MTRAYYNEVDPHAAQWLRNLIAAKLITGGEVDTRSILDVRPGELAGFDRCHFFAGIGVWDYALGLAEWPTDRPVWTGSCPCQPFSAAGGRGGFADERHLWPAFFHLIRECRPATVLGEQVASKDGLGWLDLVQADLEGEGYAVGAADLCAPGESVDGEGCPDDQWLQRAILDCPDSVLAAELRAYADWACGSISLGAPNIRQRLWFVADAGGERQHGEPAQLRRAGPGGRDAAYHSEAAGGSKIGRLAHADGRDSGAERQQRGRKHGQQPQDGGARIMGDAARLRREGRQPLPGSAQGRVDVRAGTVGVLGHAEVIGRCSGSGADASGHRHSAVSRLDTGSPRDFWSGTDWLPCRDGKARPVESGSFPLVDGAAFRLGSGSAYEGRSRAGMLKGYGNAINAQRARGFIEAVMECRPPVEAICPSSSLMAAE